MNQEKLKALPVTDLMEPISVLDPLDSVSRVAGMMRQSNQYEAFIEEEDRTAIVTIRDILKLTSITGTKLRTLMYYVPRLNQINTVGEAATMMFEHRIRSLPVYRGTELKGQITSRTVVKKLLEVDTGVKASQIMTPEPVCVDAGESVSKARQVMIRRKIDQLPVLNNGRLQGVVTSEAVVSAILPPVDRTVKGDWRRGRYDFPVENFANSLVVTNEGPDDLRKVLSNMEKSSTNFSVIQNFGEVQGIITIRDFMKLFLESRRPEFPNMYIIGLPEDPFEAELARQKFRRVVELLGRGFPEMTEARAVIKAGETKAARKKYQVRIFVMSPYWRHSYKVFRYELPDAFDYIEEWATKLLSKYRTKRARSRADRGLVQEKERVPTQPRRATIW